MRIFWKKSNEISFFFLHFKTVKQNRYTPIKDWGGQLKASVLYAARKPRVPTLFTKRVTGSIFGDMRYSECGIICCANFFLSLGGPDSQKSPPPKKTRIFMNIVLFLSEGKNSYTCSLARDFSPPSKREDFCLHRLSWGIWIPSKILRECRRMSKNARECPDIPGNVLNLFHVPSEFLWAAFDLSGQSRTFPGTFAMKSN